MSGAAAAVREACCAGCAPAGGRRRKWPGPPATLRCRWLQVVFTGNLGADPVVRELPQLGKRVASFNMAVRPRTTKTDAPIDPMW
jgi:hypothetical protein